MFPSIVEVGDGCRNEIMGSCPSLRKKFQGTRSNLISSTLKSNLCFPPAPEVSPAAAQAEAVIADDDGSMFLEALAVTSSQNVSAS